MQRPTGTVTFLFTDIEGSSRLWEEHPEPMRQALERHDTLVRDAIRAHDGWIFKTLGDAFCAVFAVPTAALAAVVDAQRALAAEPWPRATPLKVRMALHTGSAESRDDDYFGPPVNRVARLVATAHGGQSIVSQATFDLVCAALPEGATFTCLGEHRLKDLERPETVYQLLHPGIPDGFPPLASLEDLALRHNLPLQWTSFVGRAAELSELRTLLTSTHLLTLTGSGGTGKTRLALQVAADSVGVVHDGVWLVELAPLSDPDRVPAALASVFGLNAVPGSTPTQAVVEHLQSRDLLLVLDNCEHLLDASARICDRILRHCPQVRILATSREGLGIPGERTYRVPSMALPDTSRNVAAAGLADCEAVQLFVDRARLHDPEFAVTDANAASVASVCRRLDGIPLAIELAAARVRSLTPAEIDGKLDQRFRLLTGGSRTALPRQQTLRSMIDWSYNLLDPSERRLLERLSVFSGGWTLPSAEAVCEGDPIEAGELVDLMTSLVDKSLALVDRRPEHNRYRLLESVRQYACDRLLDREEGETIRLRHREHFLALARTWDGSSKRFLEEGENLRAVLESADDGSVEGALAGLEMVALIGENWLNQGLGREGASWAERLLGLAQAQEATTQRARALSVAGRIATQHGDYESAHRFIHEALEIFEVRDNVAERLRALRNLARNFLYQGRFDEALRLETEVAARDPNHTPARYAFLRGVIAKEQGDYPTARAILESLAWESAANGNQAMVASCSGHLADVARREGDLVRARHLAERGVALYRELDNLPNEAYEQFFLGRVALAEGNFDEARAILRRSLGLCWEIQDLRIIPKVLDALVEVALRSGDPQTAGRLFGGSERLRAALSVARSPHDLSDTVPTTDALRTALGGDAFDAATAQGRVYPFEALVAAALDGEWGGAPPSVDP